MSSSREGEGRAGNETPPGMSRRADGPDLSAGPTLNLKQHSTLMKVTDAYCNDDSLDMHLLSVRKLNARSVEQGKIAKRVNMVHRMSETNSIDGSHGFGFMGNITDRTMDLVKLLSTLDQFKLRNSLNAPVSEKSTPKQASEVMDGGGSGSEEGSEEGVQPELSVGLSHRSPRSGAEELLQRPWQLRLLQMEQQHQQMQQQQQQQLQQMPEGPAPDAPWSPNAQEEAEEQLHQMQGGCPEALQSFSPSPSTTNPQQPHLRPELLSEMGEEESTLGIEDAKGLCSKLPATVHSLRLLSSPDARHLLASIAAARKKPNDLTLESSHRAQKLPHPPPMHMRASSCSPTDPRTHKKMHTQDAQQQEGRNLLQQQAAASQANQGGMALPAEFTGGTAFSAVAANAAGGNLQGSAGGAEQRALPKQDGETSGVLLTQQPSTPTSPEQQQQQQQQQQQKEGVPCSVSSPTTEAASVQAKDAALPQNEATAASPQSETAAVPGGETDSLSHARAAAASSQTESQAVPGGETDASPQAEGGAAAPQTETAALLGSETEALPKSGPAAAHAEGNASRATAPSPANASKRATPSNVSDLAIPDSASPKSSRKSKKGNASGKSKGSSRSKSPHKRSKSPRKGGKSPREGSKSPSKRSSSTPKGKKQGASSRPASVPQGQSTSHAASSLPRAGAGAQKGVNKSAGGLDGELGEAQGRQLKGALKPMEKEAIGANVIDLEDPDHLKLEAAQLQGLYLQAFARCNPAGFDENEAACEVAAYSEAAERGRSVLGIAQNLPGDKKGERALWSAMQELHFRRPFLVMPELLPSSSSSSRVAAIQSAAWQQEHPEHDSGHADEPPFSQGARLQARLRGHAVASGRRSSWAATVGSSHLNSVGEALHGSGHYNAGLMPISEQAHPMESALHVDSSPHPLGGPKADGPEIDGPKKVNGQRADGSKNADAPKAGGVKGPGMGREPQARKDGQKAVDSSKSERGTPAKNPGVSATGFVNAQGKAGRAANEGGNAEQPSEPQSLPKQPPAKETKGDATLYGQQQQQQQQQQPVSAFATVEGQGGQLQQQQQQQQQQHVNLQHVDSPQKADKNPSEIPLHSSPSISFLSPRGAGQQDRSSLPGNNGGGPRQSDDLHKSGTLGRSLSRQGHGQRSKRRSSSMFWSSSIFGSKRRASSATPLEEEEEEEESPPGWSAQEHSLFAPRAKSSDSRDVLDTPECRQKQLDLDWQRLVSRHPFRYFMSKEAHPPPLIELPPPPEEDPDADGPSFTFQRLMALHAASKAFKGLTSNPSEDVAPHQTHHTTTTASATDPLRTPPPPDAPPHTKTGALESTMSSSPKMRSTPSPPPGKTSPHGSMSPHRSTSRSPLPEIGASRSPASMRRKEGALPVGSSQGSARPRTGSPGQRQASSPKLPKLPTAAERAQQAVQQKPALAWHTESWLQVQEQAPEWTPGQTLPRMQAATRQQKRTSAAPPSTLLPPVTAQPLDEATQEQQKQAEELEQALTPLQKVLAQRHPLLLSIFGSYALVVTQQQGGPDPGLMLPYPAWVALLEDCRVIDPKQPGSKGEEFLGAFEPSCSSKYPLSPQSPPSDMLMRFEYFEALIRVAVAKYVKPGQCREVHEALSTLIMEHLQGHLPAAVRQDPNTFRANLLYTPSIDATLRQAAPMLRALHASACGARRTTFLKLDGWIEVLQSCGVVGFHVGVSIPDAASIFSSSQLLVVDEIKHYWRVCGLDFLDFMEAICRVATLLDPPPRPELQRRLRECLGVTPEHILTTMAGHPYHTYYQKLALQPHDFKFAMTEGPDTSVQASDTRQQQQPEQPQQEQLGNHKQRTPVLALRHKLRALLDLIQGSLESTPRDATDMLH